MTNIIHMDTQALSNILGIVIKSHSILWGTDNILQSIAKVQMVLLDKTLSQNSIEKINHKIQTHIPLYTIDKLGEILHKPSCKAIAITNPSFVSPIIQLLQSKLDD